MIWSYCFLQNQILSIFWNFLANIGPKHHVFILSIETRPLAYFFFLVTAHRFVLNKTFMVRNRNGLTKEANFLFSKPEKPKILLKVLQLNLYQTELLFRYVFHDLTWYCLLTSEDLPRFTMICGKMLTKLVFVWHMLCRTILRATICKNW